tara:strand:+ start:5228 stop:5551 length:324 start_codon:yes stop_codon:yes gene_type:complete
MVWMGGTTEDDDGPIPVDFMLPPETPVSDGNLGNTDMMNMKTDQSAMNIMNDPSNLKAHGLAGMPNLPIPQRTLFGRIANNRETALMLGVGALLGVGIKALWDFKTK